MTGNPQKFLCVRILELNQYVPGTKSYGSVDIRSEKYDLPSEKSTLLESKTQFDFSGDIDKYNRIATIVEAHSEKEAYSTSNLVFEEAIDFHLYSGFLSNIKPLSKIGFLKNLTTSEIHPITPSLINQRPALGIMFHVMHESYEIIDPNQLVFNLENELTINIKRAAHWSRFALFEKNQVLRFLFNYISFETLAKLGPTENITGKLSLILGFPTGTYSREISPEIHRKLNASLNYRTWRKYIAKKLDEMRDLRNKIVHNGFRLQELSTPDIKVYNYLIGAARNTLKAFAIAGCYQKIQRLEDFWEMIALIFEENFNIENSFRGTFLYSLENPFNMPEEL